MLSLITVNLSYNSLEGPLPNGKAFNGAPWDAFVGNLGLCGSKQGLSPCNSTTRQRDNHQKVIILSIALSSGLFIITIFIGSIVAYQKLVKRDRQVPKIEAVQHRNLFSIWNFDGKLVYEDIIEATENFDDKYCIGKGGYGSVYRAELPTGQSVAVKKLFQSEEDAAVDRRTFINEISTLTEIRHRNIVRLYGFCSHSKCMFLVYEYMEKGSLADMLKSQEGAVELHWARRVNIIKGVARALAYMHHGRESPFVHRDISSNNILLDSNFEACASDFGTARLVQPNSSNRTMPAGTCGYMAPGKARKPRSSKLSLYLIIFPSLSFSNWI